MDATALRWALGIIGVIFIVGIYLYSLYQNKLRRQAAIKTFTHEEIESGFIEDETLRNELSSINTMLDDDLDEVDIDDIKINAALEAESKSDFSTNAELQLPKAVCDLLPDHRIVHVLKPVDNRLLTAEELRSAFAHSGFKLNEDNHFKLEDSLNAQFQILNLTETGSFQQINDEQFSTHGLVCCINLADCAQPLGHYEIMLKKVDELVRLLDLKVYSQELDLLTLQHVTDIRKKLLAENKGENE